MERRKENLSTPEPNKEQTEIVEKVYKVMSKILQIKRKDQGYKQVVYKIATDLEKKYPEPKKYYLFHMLIFSTPEAGECEHFDFPGEDSVLKTLERKLAEISKK